MTYERQHKIQKYIYFLRRKDGVGPIKIGCSRLPLVRLREFNRWSPYELELLVTTPGGPDIESALHRLFADDRLHMEWFSPSKSLMSLIDAVSHGATLGQTMPLVAAERERAA